MIMNDIVLSVEKEIDVRFSDVDMMGVVWHGSYVAYLEDAREAFGAKYGLSYMKYIVEQTAAPVVELDIKYKKPLTYGMKALVRATYRHTESAKIVFDYEIVNPEDGSVCLTATSVQVFMDMDHKLLWEAPEFYTQWKKQMGYDD